MSDFLQVMGGEGSPVSVKTALLSLLLAVALAQAIGAVYMWTFRGMSYSRSFVHAVTLSAIVACMLMLAINNSIAAGLGIAGSLAIIRFRTAMRDPRDMVFMFAALGAGIACGLRAHSAAVVGTGLFLVVVVVLTVSEFGSHRRYDGLVRFHVPTATDGVLVTQLLRRHSRNFALVTLREVSQGERMEYAYQIQLPDEHERVRLLQALRDLPGIQDLSLMLQEPTVEL